MVVRAMIRIECSSGEIRAQLCNFLIPLWWGLAAGSLMDR